MRNCCSPPNLVQLCRTFSNQSPFAKLPVLFAPHQPFPLVIGMGVQAIAPQTPKVNLPLKDFFKSGSGRPELIRPSQLNCSPVSVVKKPFTNSQGSSTEV
jgi:hypothetical protein